MADGGFPNEDDLLRLLAHVETANTRWFKVSATLLNFATRNVPETRNSRNPIKYMAGVLGGWMDEAQRRRTNRRFDKENT